MERFWNSSAVCFCVLLDESLFRFEGSHRVWYVGVDALHNADTCDDLIRSPGAIRDVIICGSPTFTKRSNAGASMEYCVANDTVMSLIKKHVLASEQSPVRKVEPSFRKDELTYYLPG